MEIGPTYHWMIFDGAKHTIRDAGNSVAHEASPLDISLAVLEGSLTRKQSEALKVYIFTQNQESRATVRIVFCYEHDVMLISAASITIGYTNTSSFLCSL